MKSCPTCKRTYADETLTFCLADGALLSAPFDPHATQVLPTPPPTTLVFGEPGPTPAAPAPNVKGTNFTWLYVIGAAFVLIFGLGMTVLLVQRATRDKQSGSTTSLSSTPMSSPEANKSSTSANTKGQTQTEESDPFAGRWTEYWPNIPQKATHVVTKRDNTYEIQGWSPLTAKYVITNVRLEGDTLKFDEKTETFTVEYELRSKSADEISVRAKGTSGWRDDIVWRRAQ